MTSSKITTLLGILAAIFGGLNAASVAHILGPTVGALCMVLGAAVAAIGPALQDGEGGGLHGALGVLGLVSVGLAAVSATDVLPALTQLLGDRGVVVVGLIGTVLAAVSNGLKPKSGAGQVPIAILAVGLGLGTLEACTSAHAEVAKIADPVLTLIAQGDTIHVVGGVTITSGTADSLRMTFAIRGAPPRTGTIIAPVTGQRQVVSVLLIPSPAYAEGDTGTVTGCPVAYRKGQAFAGSCAAPKLYTRPIVPPTSAGDTIITSMRLLPKNSTALVGDTVGFLVSALYQSGRMAVIPNNYFVNQEAGWQIVTASLGGKVDTAWIRVLVSSNEPAAYEPFAISDLSEMPVFPRAPLKRIPCPGAAWCGRWL